MRLLHRRLVALFVTLLSLVLLHSPAPTITAAEVVVMAAGDIACAPGQFKDSTHCHHEETAALLGKEPALAAVLTLGDLQYEKGTLTDFQQVYDRSWGAYKAKTWPTAGNHEYLTTDAAGYFDYFGSAAGTRGQGYYTTTVGEWRIYALNSNCSYVGGCNVGSPQYEWLKKALSQNPRCSLAYWHHPRYSSSTYGANASMDAIWDVLYRARVELVLAAHGHHYERFNRINDKDSWAADGIRSFVVGTGGKSLYGWGTIDSKSAARYNGGFGVLKLNLRGDGYGWTFVSEAGKTYSDSGSGSCQTAPSGTLLPGRFEVEDYRAGGQGTGYSDTTTGNAGGKYRTDDVDIQTTSDSSGAYNVGWVAAGEWLAYDVTVQSSGNYVFTVRTATPYSGKSFHIQVDGVDKTGALAVPNTGGYQAWTDVRSAPIALSAGPHTVKIVANTSSFNLNYVVVTTP